MNEKELKRKMRSKRKTERNKIKGLIKNKFMKGWNWGNVDFGFQLDTENKTWTVSWHKYIDFPDWFDSYAREGLENEIHIKGLAKVIYKNVSKHACIIFNNCEIKHPKKFYNLVTVFPPMWIVIPDKYEKINGKWVKVADAKIMSDKEIEEFFERNKHDKNFDEQWWRKAFEEDKKNMKYFEFVGGSEYENECWKIKKWVGMRVYGEFIIPAEGEFKPSYLDE